MAVFTDDPRPHECSQLEDRATRWVVSGTFQDRQPFPVDRVFPDLSHPDWREIRRAIRVKAGHADNFRRSLIHWTISILKVALGQF